MYSPQPSRLPFANQYQLLIELSLTPEKILHDPFPLRLYNVCVVCVCVCAKSLSHVWLCIPVDCSPPGFSVHRILQARILEWVAMPFSTDLPDPGIEPTSFMAPALADRFFTASATWETHN